MVRQRTTSIALSYQGHRAILPLVFEQLLITLRIYFHAGMVFFDCLLVEIRFHLRKCLAAVQFGIGTAGDCLLSLGSGHWKKTGGSCPPHAHGNTLAKEVMFPGLKIEMGNARVFRCRNDIMHARRHMGDKV